MTKTDLKHSYKIEQNELFYKSNSIEHGRLIKKIFYKLTDNFFNKAYETSYNYKQVSGESFLSLMMSECSTYAHFSNALSELTRVYMSEVPLKKSEGYTVDNNRSVDFWGLVSDSENGKKLNLFIELKKTFYCTSGGTSSKITTNFKEKFKNLVEQLKSIKDSSAVWIGDGNVYLGIVVVHGYHNAKKKPEPNSLQDMIESINDGIDKRSNAQLIVNTIMLSWDKKDKQNLSENDFVFGNGDICEFISFVGLVITKKT